MKEQSYCKLISIDKINLVFPERIDGDIKLKNNSYFSYEMLLCLIFAVCVTLHYEGRGV